MNVDDLRAGQVVRGSDGITYVVVEVTRLRNSIHIRWASDTLPQDTTFSYAPYTVLSLEPISEKDEYPL